MNPTLMAWQKIVQYIINAYHELKRVVWPTRAQTINHTIIVIAFSLSVALFLGALDLLFGWGLRQFFIK